MNTDRFETLLAPALTVCAAGAVLFVALHGALTGTHGEFAEAQARMEPGTIYVKLAPVKHPPTQLATATAAKRAKG
jgi:hypothetical protein